MKNGSVLKRTFQSTATVKDLFDLARSEDRNIGNADISLIQVSSFAHLSRSRTPFPSLVIQLYMLLTIALCHVCSHSLAESLPSGIAFSHCSRLVCVQAAR